MTFSYKLSRRLALLGRFIGMLALGALSCTDEIANAPPLPKPTIEIAPPALATASTSVVLVGTGSIGRCGEPYDEATGLLLDNIAGTVFTTGDNIYASGSSTDFSTCYASGWGRHRLRTRPAVGDKEYQTPGATGYFGHFGSSAGTAPHGYYSYDLGDWHVVVLNSEIATDASSPQVQWLNSDLKNSTKRCTIGIWHEPRFSSYSIHVRDQVKPLWDALYAAGAEIVLNGHYRFYERFAPQTPGGVQDLQSGIRQFTVGTGGIDTYPFDTVQPNSEVRKTGIYGVLKLTLSTDAYSWQFVPIAGQSFSESGSGTCHGTGGPAAAGGIGVRAGYYVATNGSGSGSGSITSPWTLATALAGGNGKVKPGDTIWVRGGTYAGSFGSFVHGTSSAPVVVRAYPGERAIVDGRGTVPSRSIFYVDGEYSVFWGLEIMSSDPTRTVSFSGNTGRSNTIANYASHTKYINLVVHDGGVGFYNDPTAHDVEIAGCIFYNNGWQGSDRGHGHGLYLKSNSGPVLARDNVAFNQFGYGVHAYSSSGGGQLRNIRIEGNVAFNNGTLAKIPASANILLGGEEYATGGVVSDNFTYFSPTVTSMNVQIGYGSLKNGDVTARNNLIIGGSPVLKVGYWSSPSFSDNTVALTKKQLVYLTNPTSQFSWSSTRYYNDPLQANWTYNGTSYSFSKWKSLSGLGGSDQIVGSKPTALRLYVRPNPNERGRGHVIVYNPSDQSSVTVDLSTVLSTGDTYEIRNVQRLFSSPVVSGTYSGGSVVIPVSSATPPAPVGMSTSPAPSTGRVFNVFVVAAIP